MNPMIAPLLKRYFSDYLPVQRGLAVNTVAAYRDGVKLLLQHVADALSCSVDELCVEAVDEERVLAFLQSLEDERGCSTRTRNARLAAVRSLFGFIAREAPELVEHCGKVRAITLKKTEHHVLEYIKEPEMQALLGAVDIDARHGVRDYALMLFLYNTGARVSEATAMQLDDLHLDTSPWVTLHGKGGKQRTCPLWLETADALKAWIEQRAPVDPTVTQVFLNAKDEPVTRFGVRYITRKYGVQACKAQPQLKMKPLNPHRIRHTTAMHLLHAGNDINMVSYWLGHADLNTTHMYVEIDMETKRAMLEKTEPPKTKTKPEWHQPTVLDWLDQLTRRNRLCEVKSRQNKTMAPQPLIGNDARHITPGCT